MDKLYVAVKYNITEVCSVIVCSCAKRAKAQLQAFIARRIYEMQY